MDLDSVAADLYGLKPGEFTAARDARAGDARRNGDKELAAAIKKLKRPSASAWLANLLVRDRPEEVQRLLTLGKGLREAQQQQAGEQLRALSQQRHQLVAALVAAATSVASGQNQSVTALTQRELQETLEAAVSDPAAAEALGAGRLTTPLSYSGLGTQGLEPDPAPRPGQGNHKANRADLREAQHELAAVERRRDHDGELARAELERDRLARGVQELAQQLEDLRAQLAEAEEAVERLREQLEATSAEVSAAEEQVARARASDG